MCYGLVSKPRNQPPGSAGWLVKFDSKTSKMLGHVEVTEVRGLHCVEQMPSGEPVTTLDNHLLSVQSRRSLMRVRTPDRSLVDRCSNWLAGG